MANVSVNISKDKSEDKPLKHHWSFCAGAGRAKEGLRASWQDHLELVSSNCGYKYCRFHGIFHDDMFVCQKDEEGNLYYNWQYVDDLFDRMLEHGVRPFVELSFCPSVMKSTDGTTFWWKANTSPPSDYSRWAELITEFVKHCIERFGKGEVSEWYFEVWNEPNLRPFWDGTKSGFFEFYKTTVSAIKAIDGDLRAGGPATSNFVPDDRFDGETEDKSKHITHKVEDLQSLNWKGVWIEDFLAYCEDENLPVDFISCHPYPTDFALDGHGISRNRTRDVHSTAADCRWLREVISESAYPKAELHLTEWNSSPSSRDYTHDHIQECTFLIKTNLETAGLTDSLCYWTFTDVFEEKGAGDKPFHGGFGLINYQGIPKPSFHAYRFLHNLGNRLLQTDDGYAVTSDSNTGRLSALFYNYPEEMNEMAVPVASEGFDSADRLSRTGSEKEFTVKITDLKPGTLLEIETVNREKGCSVVLWDKMERPDYLKPEQINKLKEAGANTGISYVRADENGNLELDLKLEPWQVTAVRQISG